MPNTGQPLSQSIHAENVGDLFTEDHRTLNVETGLRLGHRHAHGSVLHPRMVTTSSDKIKRSGRDRGVLPKIHAAASKKNCLNFIRTV